MKLSTLVLLFLLAFFQVSAKPSTEFAEEESEFEQYADELDTLQEEWNLEDLEDLENLQFEEGELEDFLADETEQKNPKKVLSQRTSIIKKILQLQQKLQSLVISPNFNFGSLGGLGSLGGSGSSNQLLQLLLGGGNQFGSLGGLGGFGGSSKQLTKYLKKFGKGNNGLSSLFQNPSFLQNPQLLYYLLLLQGGKGFKLPSFKLPKFKLPKFKLPKTKVPKTTGAQMCWCPCQQANAPTQTFNGLGGSFGFGSPFGFGQTGFGQTGLGFNSFPFGFGSTFEEVSNNENEAEEIVIPYQE
jgi:hypothetical protein